MTAPHLSVSSEADVVFLAINYFGSRSVGPLVESLRRQSDSRWHIVLVDNSCDEMESRPLQDIASSDERVTYLAAPTNLGYFGAGEWALTHLTLSARWVAICNVDLVFGDPQFVSTLVERQPNAIVAPNIASDTGALMNPYMRAKPTQLWMRRRVLYNTIPLVAQLRTWGSRYAQIAKRRGGRMHNAVNSPSPVQIYAPHGSLIIFPGDLLRAQGFPHHPVFLFAEELTVAVFAETHHYPIVFEPSLHVRHDEHQTTGRWRSGVLVRYQKEAARYGYGLVQDQTRIEP